MLNRVLEPEVMDTPEDARDYDAMDHSGVNRVFVADFLAVWNGRGQIESTTPRSTSSAAMPCVASSGRLLKYTVSAFP